MAAGWFERFRRRVVRRSPVGEARRRPSDLVRVVIAALLLVALAFHAHHPTKTEQSIVDAFHSLPDGATTFFRLLFDLITLWAIALLAVTVLFARRWRLARDLLVAGASGLAPRPGHRVLRAAHRPVAVAAGDVRLRPRPALPAGAALDGRRHGHRRRART